MGNVVGLKPDAQPWWYELTVNSQGGYVSNLSNTLIVLRKHPELAGRFAYDQHQLRPVVVDGLRPIESHEVTEIMVLIQHQFLRTVTRGMVVEGIEATARDHPFHPVRSYLEGLAWDGAARVDSWLATYLGAENTAYTRAIGRWFLLSMVARVEEPGCKADYTLVLEGKQGTRKSTACRILGGAWFSDILPDLRQWWGPQEHLKGKWLIEIAELSATQKTSSDQLKAFLTRQVEIYSPRKGGVECREPRQCVFVGTTNRFEYLKDATGGRRFWPVRCGTIDTDALEKDRDQLFAEALHLYRQGERWWPTDTFERDVILPEQESRSDEDPWTGLVEAYLEKDGQSQVLVKDILLYGLHVGTGRQNRANSNRVTAILQRLGWQRATKKIHGICPWVRP